jgi:hypothetical protein
MMPMVLRGQLEPLPLDYPANGAFIVAPWIGQRLPRSASCCRVNLGFRGCCEHNGVAAPHYRTVDKDGNNVLGGKSCDRGAPSSLGQARRHHSVLGGVSGNPAVTRAMTSREDANAGRRMKLAWIDCERYCAAPAKSHQPRSCKLSSIA